MEVKAKFSGGGFRHHVEMETASGDFDSRYTGNGLIGQEKTVIPKDYEQTINADSGKYLTRVIVKRIPNDQYARIKYNGSALTVY